MSDDHDQSVFPPDTSLVTHLSHAGLLTSHIYFGGYFFVLGAWWFTAVLRDQYRRDRQSRKVEAHLSFSGKCVVCSSKVVEGLVKLVACLIGVVIEAITVKSMGRPVNYTYDTIYVSFMLAAVVDIIIGLQVVLPEGIDYVAHAVAFANLGVLARSQSVGDLKLTVATRMITSYIAIFSTIALIMELYRPQSQILKFVRTSAVMLQGVWFWQTGIVLDSFFAARWIEEDHENLMYITIAFSWDMCGVVLFQIFYAALVEKIFGGHEVDGPRSHYLVPKPNRLKEPVNPEPVDDYKLLQNSVPPDLDASTEQT
ncbi:hypothetical protein Aperf_G00000011266 [Anoplocephala perfoliata]